MKQNAIFNKKISMIVVSSISALFLATGCKSTVMANRGNVPAADRELGFQKDEQIDAFDDNSMNNNSFNNDFNNEFAPYNGADNTTTQTNYNKTTSPAVNNTNSSLPPMEDMSKNPVSSNSYKSSSKATSSSNVKASGNLYTVKRGDSIGKIAVRHGVKGKDIIALNNISNPNQIVIGQKLKMPSNAKVVKSTNSSSSKASSSYNNQVVNGLYTIKSGDSISLIASRLKIKRADLMQANNINENTILRIGQKLVIPGKYQAATPKVDTTPVVTTPTINTDDDVSSMTNELSTPTTETETSIVIPEDNTVTPAPVATAAERANAPFTLEADMTVEDLCKTYGVTEQELIDLNNTIPADRIFKAQTVIIL